MLENWKNKKILILGFGREGVDSFKYLRKLFPNKILGIADKLDFNKLSPKVKKILNSEIKNNKIKLYLGKNYLKAIKNFDIVIKSPGIPIHLPEIEKAFNEGKITSQTEIFFDNCPGKIIGITGTKGKSTTASLIYQVLKKGGIKKVHLIGNIGKAVLNLLFSATQKDIYVYELSCHQLYKLKKSPQIAVFLNIYPEHLDYYKNFKEYALAKFNITKYQTENDYLIYNQDDLIIKKFAQKSKAKKIPIKGKYYELNKKAAIEVAKIFKIHEKIFKETIKNFKTLPHRLELVGTFKGITFYNDALSTIPETAIFAIEKLGNRVQTIILGGYDRKINFKNLAKKILKSKIKNIILFPTTGEKIWKAILIESKKKKIKNIPKHFFTNNMRDAVKIAYKNTNRKRICLLSCASTSFSIFRDYKEKGNLFKKYVKMYAKTL